jgi:hypothetical protein
MAQKLEKLVNVVQISSYSDGQGHGYVIALCHDDSIWKKALNADIGWICINEGGSDA